MNYRLFLAAALFALSLATPNCSGTGQGANGHRSTVTRDCGGQLCAYTRNDNAGTEIETVFCDVNDETCNGNPFGFPIPTK